MAHFARYLPSGMIDNPGYRFYAAIIVLCAVIEMIWIGGAAALATTSHFNTGPVMSTIYGLMGLIAVVLTSVTLVYGLAMLADRPPPFVAAVGISLVLTFGMTVIIAFRLAGNGSAIVGDDSLGQTLPLLGWSTGAGDLRVPHFFATHAIQIVPLAAAAVALFAAPLLTYATAIGLNVVFAVFTFATFAQALAGRPFLQTPW